MISLLLGIIFSLTVAAIGLLSHSKTATRLTVIFQINLSLLLNTTSDIYISHTLVPNSDGTALKFAPGTNGVYSS